MSSFLMYEAGSEARETHCTSYFALVNHDTTWMQVVALVHCPPHVLIADLCLHVPHSLNAHIRRLFCTCKGEQGSNAL